MEFFRFKSLLASFSPDGKPKKEIEISDVKYNIFQVTFIFNEKKIAPVNPDKRNSPDLICEICALVQMMMSYLYCGGTESLKNNVPDLLEVGNTKQHIHTCVITWQF